MSCFELFVCQNSWLGGAHLPATTCSAVAKQYHLGLLGIGPILPRGNLRGHLFFGPLHVPSHLIVRRRGLDWRLIVSETKMLEKWFFIRLICSAKCNLNTCHSMARWRGEHRSFYGCCRVRRRLSPRPPQWNAILGFLFGFVQTIRRTNERADGRTNKQNFCVGVATDLSRGSVHRPQRCCAGKGATQDWVRFSANQKLIPLTVRYAILVLWRARRSYDNRFAFANALEPLAQQQTRRQRL